MLDVLVQQAKFLSHLLQSTVEAGSDRRMLRKLRVMLVDLMPKPRNLLLSTLQFRSRLLVLPLLALEIIPKLRDLALVLLLLVLESIIKLRDHALVLLLLALERLPKLLESIPKLRKLILVLRALALENMQQSIVLVLQSLRCGHCSINWLRQPCVSSILHKARHHDCKI